LRRISCILDQALLAFDERPAERAALLIVEFKLQTTVPASGVAARRQLGKQHVAFGQCLASDSGAKSTVSDSLPVIVV
jgi:hypothetical protein